MNKFSPQSWSPGNLNTYPSEQLVSYVIPHERSVEIVQYIIYKPTLNRNWCFLKVKNKYVNRFADFKIFNYWLKDRCYIGAGQDFSTAPCGLLWSSPAFFDSRMEADQSRSVGRSKALPNTGPELQTLVVHPSPTNIVQHVAATIPSTYNPCESSITTLDHGIPTNTSHICHS